MRHRISGFTMIEVLVVISIIGVLAAVMLSGINPITQLDRARDTRAKGQLKQVQNAFESYYADNQAYGDNCDDMDTGLQTGLPNELSGWNCTVPEPLGSGYCACSRMKIEDSGNSFSDICDFEGVYEETTKDYFCVQQLQ